MTRADLSALEDSASQALEKLISSAEKRQQANQAQQVNQKRSDARETAAEQQAASVSGADSAPRSVPGTPRKNEGSETLRNSGSFSLTSPGAFSPSQNSGANGLTAFSLVDAATGKPLPELEATKAVRRKVELKAELAKQLAEHQAAEIRGTLLHQSYVSAEGEMLARANEVENRRKAEQQRKIAEDAALTRRQLAERAAAREAEEARQKAEDEATLARMIALYEADMEKFRERQRREKEALMASKRENDEQRRIRELERQRAEEEELRRQADYAEKVRAAENAHKNKYRHIAEKQDHLAKLLIDATAEHREKMDSFYRIQEEKAAAQAMQDARDLQRRKEEKKKKIHDTTAVVREQMKEKEKEREFMKKEEAIAAQQAREEAEGAAEMRRRIKDKKNSDKKEFMEILGKQLEQKLELEQAEPSPKLKPYADGKGTSLVLNTKSSDADTETLFKLTQKAAHGSGAGDALRRGNRSDEIAPLLGFGAPFLTKIEQDSQLAEVPVPDPDAAIQNMQPRLAFGGTQPSNLVIKASKSLASPAPAKK